MPATALVIDPKVVPRKGPVRTGHVDIQLVYVMTRNQEASKQVSSTPPQPKENVLNAHTKVEEALCNAVGTQESVTAVPVVPDKLKSTESEVLTYAMLETWSTGLFILDDIATTLGSKGVNTKFVVKTSFFVILLFLNKDFVPLVSFSSFVFCQK